MLPGSAETVGAPLCYFLLAMKKLLLLLAVAAAAFAQTPAQPQDRSPEQRERKMRNIKQSPAEYDSIKAEVNAMAKAWNQGDVAGMSAYMGNQVSVVTPAGKAIVGRQEVDKYHADIMKKHFAGSHKAVNVRDIRFVRPRVALCDVEVTITRYKSLPPGISVKAGQPFRLLTRYVLSKDARDWTIAAAQSTVLRDGSQ